MPKNQSTAAKKARGIQKTEGGKHTVLLAQQVCGQQLDPFGVYPEACARLPHPPAEPCSQDRDFDVAAWQQRVQAEATAEEERRAALTPEDRAEEERLAFEDAHDDGYSASDAYEDARSYKWED